MIARAAHRTRPALCKEPRMAHTIRCAHDDCPEISTRASFQPTTREQEAADHRRSLAGDGWSDVEGRDYCPDHKPSA